MRTKLKELWVLGYAILLVLGLMLTSARAQTMGTIGGRVVDASTGDFLPGANVLLKGTNFGSATDREGNYRISKVPPGTYTLVVRYIGHEEFSTQVTVVVDSEVEQNVQLKPSAVQLSGVEITGFREGQVKALSQQRIAANIKNVVAREQMETFPDLNTAEVLQRVPGVNITRDLGEGRFVFIRGTEPRLTTVTVNGQKIATPEDEERFVALDVISANQLASIDVTKTITPDMDGDAIGGVVNLETRSAFDYQGRYLKVSGGSGYNELSQKPNYQGSFTYNTRLGSKQSLGFSLSGNWQQANRTTHNNEMKWGKREDVNGNTIPFALREIELRDYLNQRNRYGFSSRLEFRPSEGSRLWVSGMFNRRDDDQRRNQFRIRIDKGKYVTPTQIQKARMIRALQDRVESQTIIAVNGGGEHTFKTLDVQYDIGYSYGKQEKSAPDGQIIPEFQLDEKVNLDLDLSHVNTPRFSITNLAPGYELDPSHYEIDAFDFRTQFTSDKDFVGSLNLKLPYQIGSASASLKFGGRVRSKTKDRNNNRLKYKWKGDQTLLMSQFATDDVRDDFMDSAYNFGPSIAPGAIRDFFQANRDLANGFVGSVKAEDTFGEKYDAGEDIYAYYLMTSINIGKLLILGGVRHEFTHTDYTGTLLQFDDNGDFAGASDQSDSRNYNNFFPNLQFRYAVSERTNLRLAFTTGIARANYFDLVPFLWINPDDQQILKGNSKLDPTTSFNIDVLAEHYLSGIGIISAGVFYKDLNDIIYTRNFVQQGGPFDGFDVEQPVNGGGAKLIGVEFNWQQQFTFLPGFLSGFGIYANFTHTEATDVNLFFRERSDKLPGQASDAGNVALTYQKSRFTARLALNYNGKFIDEVGKNEDFDEWRDNHTQLDFSASYRVSRGLNAFLDLINLTNEPRLDYLGTRRRVIQHEKYSFWVNAGFRWNL